MVKLLLFNFYLKMEKPMKNVRLGNLLSGSNFNIFAFLTRYTKFWPSEKICAENGPKRLKYYWAKTNKEQITKINEYRAK